MGWTREVYRLPERHGWTATPDHKILVLDRGTVLLEFPADWTVEPGPAETRMRDGASALERAAGHENDPLSLAGCWEVVSQMFPHGLADPAIVEQLLQLGHPSLPPEAAGDLLGACLWDVFSNNHEVTRADGRAVDLGSFRSAAGFIADFRAQPSRHDHARHHGWGYLDFYMGTIGMRGDDLFPVYQLIFERMRGVGLDWRYVHPRLYLIELGEPDDEPRSFDEYDPGESVARELERRRREGEIAKLREDLDRAYRESVEQARVNPPPSVVQAYCRVYGRWPQGWPPA